MAVLGGSEHAPSVQTIVAVGGIQDDGPYTVELYSAVDTDGQAQDRQYQVLLGERQTSNENNIII